MDARKWRHRGRRPAGAAGPRPPASDRRWVGLPPVQPAFEAYVAAHGLSYRLRFYPGAFFADPLPTADVLVLDSVLHNWSLDQRRLLLTKAYAALPAGGALIVKEALIDDERRHNTAALLASLHTLLNSSEGANFAAAECQAWMTAAGFHGLEVEHLAGPCSMIVGFTSSVV